MFRIKKFKNINESALTISKLPINPKCPICGAMSDRQDADLDNQLCVKREHSEPDDVFEPAVAHYVCRGKETKKKEEFIEDDTVIPVGKSIHDFYLPYEPQ